MKHRLPIIILLVVAVIFILVLLEFLYIKYTGKPVSAPVIPRTELSVGKGPGLRYIIMGDSTSIGQGTNYENSYAVASARHLAKHYTVHYTNVGVSGATAKAVYAVQLRKAVIYKPDLVLLAVGANDARKFVSGGAIRGSLQTTINGLKAANPGVRIVLTGSPAMDTVPRFPWPANKLMGLRTRQVNNVVTKLIQPEHNVNLTFAPVADKTRAAFMADPTLFAPDKFHPNARGYDLWKPVINDALDRALAPVSTL